MSLYEKYRNVRDWLGMGALLIFIVWFFTGLFFLSNSPELESHPVFGWTLGASAVWLYSSGFAKLFMLPKDGEKEKAKNGEEGEPEQTIGHWALNLIAILAFLVFNVLIGQLPNSGPVSTSIYYEIYKILVNLWFISWVVLDVTETIFHIYRSRLPKTPEVALTE
jgi:hypothetical protein